MGARLSAFADKWEILEDRSSIRVLQYGLPLSFLEKPPLSRTPLSFPSRNQPVLARELQQLLQKRAVEPVLNTDSPGFYNRLFVVPKESGGWRPVIDLSEVNRYLRVPRFKMETANSIRHSLRRGEWVVSIDLKDAYFHVPLATSARKFTRFVIDGRSYQFRALPFGLATAPLAFTKLLLPVLSFLRRRGIRVHAYLDDWLIRANSPEDLQEKLDFTLELLEDLGLIVNYDKSELTPTQSFIFLGMQIDLLEATVAPAPKHRKKLLGFIAKLRARRVSSRFLAKVLGLLQFLAPLVHRGKLHLRSVQHWVRAHWVQSRGNWSDMIRTDPRLRDILSWWTLPHLLEGVPLRGPKPQRELCTDASTAGWGANLGARTASGLWGPSCASWHINLLEMEAVIRAVERLNPWMRGLTVRLNCDNRTTVAYIRNEGGVKSTKMTRKVAQLLELCDRYSIHLIPVHLPGSRNVLADSLSRRFMTQPGEWTLNRQILRSVFDLWGFPVIDMFATSANRRLHLYVSPYPDGQALGVDALTLDWNFRYLVYAFPPTPLIPRVLDIIREIRGTTVILIAPNSPARYWYPDLLELAIEGPLDLPLTRSLLSQRVPGLARLVYHLRPEALNLAAWLL